MRKAKITVTVTRVIELDPEVYDEGMSSEDMLKEEIRYAEDLFHEWIEAESVQWKTEGVLLED